MLASTRSATGFRCSMCRFFSSSTSCWISHILSRSRPVSYSPPSSAATTLSVAGFGRVLDEQLHRVIREVAFGDEVLAADQRLYGRVGRGLVELAQEIPRVLVDEQLRLERRAAESLHRREADGVHLGCDRNDLVGPEIAADFLQPFEAAQIGRAHV